MDLNDELAEFARLRDTCPVSTMDPGVHLLVHYVDVLSVLRDEAGYDRLADEAVPSEARAIWAANPHEHGRRRLRLLNAERVAAGADAVAEISRAWVAAATNRQHCDLSADLIAPLTRDVIATLVGIPAPDRTEVFSWVDAMGTAFDRPEHERETSWRAGADPLREWVVAERSRRGASAGRATPDDGFALLLEPDQIDGRRATDEELLAYVYLLCRSGVGPLARLLGNVIHRLALERSVIDALRAAPDGASALVEAVLRDDPPVQFLLRSPAADVVIHGCSIEAGDTVIMSVTSANRDRAGSALGLVKHVSFGRGEHFCPAASFGRQVARQFVLDLVENVDEIRLHVDADLVALHATKVWTPVRLPATLVPRRER